MSSWLTCVHVNVTRARGVRALHELSPASQHRAHEETEAGGAGSPSKVRWLQGESEGSGLESMLIENGVFHPETFHLDRRSLRNGAERKR